MNPYRVGDPAAAADATAGRACTAVGVRYGADGQLRKLPQGSTAIKLDEASGTRCELIACHGVKGCSSASDGRINILRSAFGYWRALRQSQLSTGVVVCVPCLKHIDVRKELFAGWCSTRMACMPASRSSCLQ